MSEIKQELPEEKTPETLEATEAVEAIEDSETTEAVEEAAPVAEVAEKEAAKKECFIKKFFAPPCLKKTIAVLVAAVIVIAIVVGSLVSYMSPGNVACRFVEASIFENYTKLFDLTAFDLEKQLLDGEEYEVFFEEVSDRYNEDIYNWKDYSKFNRIMMEEDLEYEFGEYKISIEASRIKDMSIRRLKAMMEDEIEDLEKEGLFDEDLIKDVKEVIVKAKIKGEDSIEREEMTVYLVKMGGAWKVLEFY